MVRRALITAPGAYFISSSKGEVLASMKQPEQQEEPLTLEDAKVLLEPFRLACESQHPKLMEPALDCLHKVGRG